jgi:hypothetical protein
MGRALGGVGAAPGSGLALHVKLLWKGRTQLPSCGRDGGLRHNKQVAVRMAAVQRASKRAAARVCDLMCGTLEPVVRRVIMGRACNAAWHRSNRFMLLNGLLQRDMQVGCKQPSTASTQLPNPQCCRDKSHSINYHIVPARGCVALELSLVRVLLVTTVMLLACSCSTLHA